MDPYSSPYIIPRIVSIAHSPIPHKEPDRPRQPVCLNTYNKDLIRLI